MKKKYIKFIVIPGIIIAATVLILFLNKGIGGQKANDNNMEFITVESRDKIYVNGKIAPEQSENIYLDSTKGKVDSVSIENRQVVEVGQVLFTYKNDAITEQIESLNSQLTSNSNQKQRLKDKKYEASINLENEKAKINELRKSFDENGGIVDESALVALDNTIQSYDDQIYTIDSQIKGLNEQIYELKQKEYTEVTAPIAGKVSISDDTVNLSAPYMVIDSVNLIVNGIVSEKDHFKLINEQAAEILVMADNKTLTGKISKIGDSPIAVESLVQTTDNNISQYEVLISLDSQENLINGYHVQATVLENDYSITIPKTAIVSEDNKNYVYKVVDGKLSKVEVTYTDADAEKVTIESGLQEEEKVLSNPTLETKEGVVVE